MIMVRDGLVPVGAISAYHSESIVRDHPEKNVIMDSCLQVEARQNNIGRIMI
jgi:hypothetical protein